MSKYDMIDAIRAHNPSATYEFLNDFDEPALDSYLQRLTERNDRGGPIRSTDLVPVGGSVVSMC